MNLSVCLSVFHAAGCGFMQGHTKEHRKNDSNCLLARHSGVRVGVCNATQ